MPCCRRAPCARGRAVHARWRQAQALLGVVVFSTVAVCLVYYWIAAHSRGGAAAVEVAVRQVQSQQGMCAHTLGDWCSIWLHGKVSAAPAQLLTSPGPDKPCPGNCSSIGNCDTTLGVCSCPAAWGGVDCSQAVKRPCTHRLGGLRRMRPAPFSHIGPDKLDLNLSYPVFSYGRCAGVCDDEYGRCYCRGPGRYGRIPAPDGSPPGAPPIRQGRPAHFPCSHPTTGPDGAKLRWGRGPTWEQLYGPDGWCVADAPTHSSCGCPYDGMDGQGCNAVTEHTCLNQCSGRGQCVQQGFCKCPDGWYGLDCAYPSSLAVAAAAAHQAAITTHWVEHTAVDAWRCYNSSKGCLEERVRRAWMQAQSELSSSRQAASPPARGTTAITCSTGGPVGAAGCDEGTGQATTSNRLSKPAAGTGNIKLPTHHRPRPLIYVYNVPESVVSHVFQYRRGKETCGWRIYKEHNTTQLLQDVYGIEVLFLDMLLGSQHRTLNPEEADYFYVPVLSSCWMTYVQGEQDWPWFNMDSYSRVKGAAVMYQRALDYVKTAYPAWNASQGADHIWMFTHDEGACWAPAELYEKGIILTAWGRNTPDNHPSHTNYGQDNYSHDVRDDPALPQGSLALIGRHPCYTPGKDIVVPNWKMPATYASSPYLGAPAVPRDILAFHKGRVMSEFPRFSLGVRQRLDAVARAGNWSSKYNIRVEADQPGSYSELVARSVFCFVMQGDGWSARFTSAVVHGCIPVILMDVADPPFGAELDWQAISVRIPVADIPRIPQLLQSISSARVAAMQSAMARMWHRMVWLSHPVLVKQVTQMYAMNRAGQAAARHGNRTPVTTSLQVPKLEWFQNDAFQTIMQVLHHRLRITARQDQVL